MNSYLTYTSEQSTTLCADRRGVGITKESAVERCDCLVLDPCGCFVDPCVCVRTDERGCYTDCGCPDRSSAVLRTPLI